MQAIALTSAVGKIRRESTDHLIVAGQARTHPRRGHPETVETLEPGLPSMSRGNWISPPWAQR